jgi:hypothetical protein
MLDVQCSMFKRHEQVPVENIYRAKITCDCPDAASLGIDTAPGQRY